MHVNCFMEGGDTGEEKKKKISFGFSLADEKIKLIDILSEDDDFLVASPFCDSLEDSFSGLTPFLILSDVNIYRQKNAILFS